MDVDEILGKYSLTKEDIVFLLSCDKDEAKKLYKKAEEVKLAHLGRKVYYRGLIEFSNLCKKDCLYCGIRASNKDTVRFELSEEQILEAVKFAHERRYASVVFQAGERTDQKFIDKIDRIIHQTKELSNGEIGITLSVGEQSEETYKRWFDSGAHRYLLRIETTNEELYYKIHPKNDNHDFGKRMKALASLKKIGYQVGTGVMIGLPFQTIDDLANDILFFTDFDIDMNGMGPYIEHPETPLYEHKDMLMTKKERFELSLRMIAILRIKMKDINIAAATSLQAIDKVGREKAIRIGANVIMPNITPTLVRANYQLYEGKPCIDEAADDCSSCLEARIGMAGGEVGYGEWGDSKHFKDRTKD